MRFHFKRSCILFVRATVIDLSQVMHCHCSEHSDPSVVGSLVTDVVQLEYYVW